MAEILNHIALRQAAMYPPKESAGKDTAAISKAPIGTGLYKFVRWTKDEIVDARPSAERPRSTAVLRS
jgi:ABC-type transport system substrate-binding protein